MSFLFIDAYYFYTFIYLYLILSCTFTRIELQFDFSFSNILNNILVFILLNQKFGNLITQQTPQFGYINLFLPIGTYN